jgi:hypothetical protein
MTPNSASSHSLHSLGRSTTLRAPYANVIWHKHLKFPKKQEINRYEYK